MKESETLQKQTNKPKKKTSRLSNNRWIPKDIEDVVTPFPIKTVSLYEGFLDVALEWCYKKNCGFGPEDFCYSSNVKAWWQCSQNEEHVWRAPISNRTGLGSGCPFCYEDSWGVDLRDYPKALELFDKQKNKRVDPYKLAVGKSVWWTCPVAKDHRWMGWFLLRHADNPCPFCRGVRPSSTHSIETNPELKKQFHPTKNKGLAPGDVTPGSKTLVFWICPKNEAHVWEATPCDRAHGYGCPYCSRRLLSKEFTLSAKYPLFAKEFHPTKNEGMKADKISSASKVNVWWQCLKDKSHEWQSPVANRVKKKAGCPYCDNRMLSKTNSLALNKPEIAKEFHLRLNYPLTPEEVVFCSPKPVYWKCSAGHEYRARILDRAVYGKGCTSCSPMLRAKPLSRFKDLVKELHPTKNGDLDPAKVSSASEKKVWWQCPQSKDHEWEASPHYRAQVGTGCPFCANLKVARSNCLAKVRPDIAKELHPTKNGQITAKDVVPGSAKELWWKCKHNPRHIWQAPVYQRTRADGSGCPKCGTGVGGKIKSGTVLAIAHPDVARDWHPTKNGNLTPEKVTAKSALKAWWRCSRNPKLTFAQEIGERVRRGCTYCRIYKKSLKALFPKVAKRLHPTKNKGLYPDAVTASSSTVAWWICPVDSNHVYQSVIKSVTKSAKNGTIGCPYCNGDMVDDSNSLAKLSPEIAAEWNYKRNGERTPKNVSTGSNYRAWWICKEKHEWQSPVYSRALQNSECRTCSYERRRRK